MSVPDVTCLSFGLGEVAAQLGGVGSINPDGTAPVNPLCSNPNKIAAQDPPPGEEVETGTVVNVYTGDTLEPEPGAVVTVVRRRGRSRPTSGAILEPHFSSLESPVFALTNLPEVVKGALFARYSRTTKSLRRLFLDEFAEDVTPTARSRRWARSGPSSSTSGCSWSTATTRWPSSAACTSRASRRRSCSARRWSGDGWRPTWSSPPGTCATTTGPADGGAPPSRPRSPAPISSRGSRRSSTRFRARTGGCTGR